MHARNWSTGLGLAVLLLAGCDNTNVAFCSGGEAFCDRFFDETLTPEEPEDEGSDIRAALDAAQLTPQPVVTALQTHAMESLIADDPELVGLWLTAGSLGRMTQTDNLTTTDFLDQQRAWLSHDLTVEHPLLVAGLGLFADFATRRDPALADIAGSLADPPNPPSDLPAMLETVQARSAEILSALPTADCCTATQLAASAVVLCDGLFVDQSPLGASADSACAEAVRWLIANP